MGSILYRLTHPSLNWVFDHGCQQIYLSFIGSLIKPKGLSFGWCWLFQRYIWSRVAYTRANHAYLWRDILRLRLYQNKKKIVSQWVSVISKEWMGIHSRALLFFLRALFKILIAFSKISIKRAEAPFIFRTTYRHLRVFTQLKKQPQRLPNAKTQSHWLPIFFCYLLTSLVKNSV